MPRRHPPPLPTTWLFSDERLEIDVATLAATIPPGSGIVVRHDSLATGARWRLVRRLVRIARARQLTILLADRPDTARRWGADGVHLRQRNAHRSLQAHRLGLALTIPVHDAREARTAFRAEATAVFVSPFHITRSHADARALGPQGWARLARSCGVPAIALGGMNANRARRLRRAQITDAWAAIDHWQERAAKRRTRQKRNCVPT